MKFKLVALFTLLATTAITTAHANPSTAKATPKADSVEYFYANPKLALDTVRSCDTQVATLSDHEKIYGAEGKCRNAMLARKQIAKQRNSASNAKPTFDFSHLNKPKQ